MRALLLLVRVKRDHVCWPDAPRWAGVMPIFETGKSLHHPTLSSLWRKNSVTPGVHIVKCVCIRPLFSVLCYRFPLPLDAGNFKNIDVIFPEEFQGPPLAKQSGRGEGCDG